ncbi:MAG: ubiquinol-cytochrome c reductase iron-sulfur subunit [Alphaproteobacteria bacterium]|nr:MAG: ubiquinol-cytochrome c reductase iron-sulfur subunit [Alphaproteobacteria bacterium]
MAEAHVEEDQSPDTDRRDFLYIATTAVAGIGAAISLWPFIDQMNPTANVQALATTEVDLSPIETGQTIKVVWQGKPVYVRHRTQEQIKAAQSAPVDDLPDPETDADRVQQDQWLIVVGICTHLGCIPVSDPDNLRGEFGGWFCPCHGSHYDDSGRIRKGPAPDNLAVPPYQFIDDNKILIG